MNFDCYRMLARSATPILLALSTWAAAGQTNGIYADFTTSLGSFTCQLNYTNAPRTTANFIGLATGQRAWLDLTTGCARTNAFYDGLIFHRVIAGFMNQGGSPNGMGTDGPGYVIKDEFSRYLVFTNFGVLAMANSGPNSGGSQFFITVASYTYGNSNYAIFGKVVSGSNVVWAINHVATDANDKPLTNVVMQQVGIRRVGTAAQAFDINGQGLPVVTNLHLAIAAGSNQVTLAFTNRQYADNQLYSATNVAASSWTAAPLGIEITAPVTNSVQQSEDAPQGFYALAQVQYASSTFAPKDLYGRTLAINLGADGIMTLRFDSAGGGTYTFPPSFPSGTVTSYSWAQQAYRGMLSPLYLTNIAPIVYQLNFTNNTGGTVSGTVYSANPFSVTGPFSLTGP